MSKILVSNIKELARHKDITVAELERNLGFGISSISKWVNSTPGLDKVVKVAEYFGVTLDTLCSYPLNPSSLQSQLVTEKVIEMLTDGRLKLSCRRDGEYIVTVGDYLFIYNNDSTNLLLQNGGVVKLLPLTTGNIKSLKNAISMVVEDAMLNDVMKCLSAIN